MEVQKSLEVKKLITEVDTLCDNLKEIRITNVTANNKAGEWFLEIRGKIKQLEDLRFSFTRPLDESKANILAFFNVPINRLKALKNNIDNAMLIFKQEQDRKRYEEERLRREAEAKAVLERERLAREEERLRREAEEARKKAEQATKAEQLKKAQESIKKAEKLEEKAEEIQQEKQEVRIEAKMPRKEIKVEGLSVRKNWKFRIIDTDKIPRQYMLPDEKQLGEIARRDKEKAEVSGVEFFSEEIHV